jgi:hypothetical protein
LQASNSVSFKKNLAEQSVFDAFFKTFTEKKTIDLEKTDFFEGTSPVSIAYNMGLAKFANEVFAVDEFADEKEFIAKESIGEDDSKQEVFCLKNIVLSFLESTWVHSGRGYSLTKHNASLLLREAHQKAKFPPVPVVKKTTASKKKKGKSKAVETPLPEPKKRGLFTHCFSLTGTFKYLKETKRLMFYCTDNSTSILFGVNEFPCVLDTSNVVFFTLIFRLVKLLPRPLQKLQVLLYLLFLILLILLILTF